MGDWGDEKGSLMPRTWPLSLMSMVERAMVEKRAVMAIIESVSGMVAGVSMLMFMLMGRWFVAVGFVDDVSSLG